MDLLAAFARWTIQVALTFAGKGTEGFIRFDDFLQAIGFSSGRQNQEPMTPVKTGIFVYLALPGARSLPAYRQSVSKGLQNLRFAPQSLTRR